MKHVFSYSSSGVCVVVYATQQFASPRDKLKPGHFRIYCYYFVIVIYLTVTAVSHLFVNQQLAFEKLSDTEPECLYGSEDTGMGLSLTDILIPLYSFLGANGFLQLQIGEVSINVMAATVCVRAHLVPLCCHLSVQPLSRLWLFYHSRHEFLSLWSPFKLSKGAQCYRCTCACRSHTAPVLSWLLGDTYVSTKLIRAALQLKHKNCVVHTYLKPISGRQPPPSMAAPRHVAAFAPDICHSELSYLTCESLASHCRGLAKTAA